ncbi:MAG: hypothetical protein Q8P84_01615 [Deltaproteobacteria bacterium]|nr:hypothetical protein [Deltaproteobacteria bacterium]
MARRICLILLMISVSLALFGAPLMANNTDTGRYDTDDTDFC